MRHKKQYRCGVLHSCECWLLLVIRTAIDRATVYLQYKAVGRVRLIAIIIIETVFNATVSGC